MTVEHIPLRWCSRHEQMTTVPCFDCIQSDLEQALSLLEKHEYPDNNDDSPKYHRCPECNKGRRWSGHLPTCTWALLLQKYGRSVKFSD